jgi:hypothetical protein
MSYRRPRGIFAIVALFAVLVALNLALLVLQY